MSLNQEQARAFELVKSGHNVLLTSSAGCGKTHTLKYIVQWAHQNRINIGVTASTGSAAFLLKGRTIHSFLGIGLGTQSVEYLTDNIKTKRQNIFNTLKKLDILVIDEISMINADLFEKISKILSIIRNKPDEPFGGVKLILCGDMAQARPIEGSYCFKSSEWDRANISVIILSRSMRHDSDSQFKEILDQLRIGNCTDDIIKILENTKNNKFRKIAPTILFTKNADADTINNYKLNELIETKGEYNTKVFKTEYSCSNARSWASSMKVPEESKLVIGAMVLLTWNVDCDAGLVNGSRGIITDFVDNKVQVKFVDGVESLIEVIQVTQEDNERVWIKYMPLRLAYAITFNRSQGMTLDAILIPDLGKSVFDYGLAYTALSRARDLNTVKILKVSAKAFKTHPDVLEFYRKYT